MDAPAREMPQDQAILDAARAGVEALNARHAEGRRDRFYLVHRVRQWNPREGVFMGWERKRGKIEEWNRLLRGATDTSFTVEAGDASIFPAVRYCITLDSDTRLPRDAAKKLIGIAAHPLNQPPFDARVGRVTEGYAILQPRVSVTMASAAGSLFARLYAGHTGVDPYTTAVSDTYEDLFAEGIFTGRGSTTWTRNARLYKEPHKTYVIGTRPSGVPGCPNGRGFGRYWISPFRGRERGRVAARPAAVPAPQHASSAPLAELPLHGVDRIWEQPLDHSEEVAPHLGRGLRPGSSPP